MPRPPHARSARPRLLALLAVALAALPLLSGCSLLQGAGAAVCQNVTVPVGLPTGEHGVLAGTYCRPARSSPTTILVAVHGATYNRDYWAWPELGGQYSFVRRAVAAGYAIVAIDRLGDGQSLRPLSTHDTAAVQVSTLHQLIQAVRGGHLGMDYRHVLWVGHSLGSYYGVALAAQHPHDLDAMILTGFGAHVSAQMTQLDEADLVPARDLVGDRTQFPGYARFAALDPGYLSNRPGTRVDQLADGPDHRSTDEDPAVLAYDQASEDVLSRSELTARPADLGALLARLARVPILVMDGSFDQHYCSRQVYDCTTTSGWLRGEAAGFPPAACLAGQLEPAGHDLQLSRASAVADAAMLRWAAATVPPRAAARRCALRGPITTAGVALP